MSLNPQQISYDEEHASDNRGPSIYIANIVCFIAATIAVGLRFFSRHLKKASYGRDDWSLVLGLFFFLLYVILSSVSTAWGLGRHVLFITNTTVFYSFAIAIEVAYIMTLPTIKLSVLFLYARIFPQHLFQLALLAMKLVLCGYSISVFFAIIFQCTPVRFAWDRTISGGRCINYGTFVFILGIINIITDFVIVAMPMPLLWGLNLTRTKKIYLSGIIISGALVCIVSIIRLFFVRIAGYGDDPSWNNVNAAITSSVESCVAIISACLPTYKPLLKWIQSRKNHESSSALDFPERHENIYQQQPVMLDYINNKTRTKGA